VNNKVWYKGNLRSRKRNNKFLKEAQKRKNTIRVKIHQVQSKNTIILGQDLVRKENLKDKNRNEKRKITAKARASAKANHLA